MLTENSDGSYKIKTAVTNAESAVEVSDASDKSGANIQQWEINSANCQDWILESVSDPGCAMDTSVVYTFENVNSGLVMDILNAEMSDNANVQQYQSNKFDCQKWILKAFGSGNYYWIRSVQDNGFALRAEGSENGSNIDITAYSSKDSSQLFRFTKNLDSSYSIISHASGDSCLVEAAYASKENGANIQQWQPTGNDCQKWNAVTEVTTVVTTTVSETSASVTEPPVVQITGDVNDDGVFSIADIVMLKRWLLDNGELKNTQASDVCEDGVINILDLCVIRRMLIAK